MAKSTPVKNAGNARRDDPPTALAVIGALLLVLLVTATVYWPARNGPLVVDDSVNLSRSLAINSDDSLISEQLLSDSGLLGRPVSMFSFALEGISHGNDTAALKRTNILLHLVAGLLVFWVVALVLALPGEAEANHWWLACAIAAAWLLHPIHVSTVLYLVQRMTMLAGIFTLAGLIAYLSARISYEQFGHHQAGIFLAFFLWFPLAAFSKETGLAFPLYIAAIEAIWFDGFSRARAWLCGGNARIFAVTLLALGVLLVYGWLWPQFQRGIEAKPFTLLERVISEPRVMIRYLQMLLAPSARQMGFIHDDFEASSSLVTPWTTVPAMVTLAGFGIAAWQLREHYPLVAWGIMMFFAGHALEAGPLPLDLLYEHRNYIPALGGVAIMMGAFLYLRSCGWRRTVLGAMFVIWIIFLGAITHSRVQAWCTLDGILADGLKANPQSPILRSVLAQQHANRGNYADALRVLAETRGNGAAVQRLVTLCMRDGRVADHDLYVVSRSLKGRIDGYELMNLEDFASLRLDRACQANELILREILEGARNRAGGFGRAISSITIYHASMLHEQGHVDSAIDLLLREQAYVADDPTMSFLAVEWLLLRGEMNRAREVYCEVLRSKGKWRAQAADLRGRTEDRLHAKLGPRDLCPA